MCRHRGCWRMRGIGMGQTIDALCGADVVGLIKSLVPGPELPAMERALSWLMLSGMQSEQRQCMALNQQDLCHLWRRRVFNTLVRHVDPASKRTPLAAGTHSQQVSQGAAHLIRISPMIGRACVSLLCATNKGSAFHSGNISWI